MEEDLNNFPGNRYRKGNFFCVYMLHCLNPKIKNKVYIGFTTNPKRRLQQHNEGRWAGGAKKTTCKGVWEMVAIIHQFPNKISALAFEWAWQHPEISRRLRHVEPKQHREPKFNYYCRVLQELLSVGPWNKLPLEISWLNETYLDLVIDRVPKHMPWQLNTEIFSLNTSLLSKRPKTVDFMKRDSFNCPYDLCTVCYAFVPVDEKIVCINDECSESFHMTCLAVIFSVDGELLPVEGFCPRCNKQMLWGDLIFNRHDLIDEDVLQKKFCSISLYKETSVNQWAQIN